MTPMTFYFILNIDSITRAKSSDELARGIDIVLETF